MSPEQYPAYPRLQVQGLGRNPLPEKSKVVYVVVVVALGGQGRACDRGNGNRQDERIPSRAALGRLRVRGSRLRKQTWG